jgi:putative Holliday junction resolvase
MRTMALDFGKRRIGVAVTDPTGVLAQPLETIHWSSADADTHLRRIAEIVAQYDVGRIVVGLPLHLDGRHGREADEARAFGEAVARRTKVAVEFLDERWTTLEAKRLLRETGSRKRERVDPIAAAILLRTYIEGRGA